jgi:hypothetical protein
MRKNLTINANVSTVFQHENQAGETVLKAAILFGKAVTE